MEIRKIQSIGGSSLSLILLKKWALLSKLKNKDEVITSPQASGSLVVVPQKVLKARQNIDWDIHTLGERELEREIIVLYISGYDNIKIFSNTLTPAQKRRVKNTVAKLAGMETIEEAANEIQLINLLAPEKFSFEDYLEKMFGMCKVMIMDSFNSFLHQDETLAKDVIERDSEVDKIDFLILRMYNSLQQNLLFEEQLQTSLLKADFYQSTSRQLERIADHSVKIGGLTLLRAKKTLPEKSIKILTKQYEDLQTHLDSAKDIVFNLNKNNAHKLISALEKSQDLEREITEEATKHNLPYTIIVSDSFDRMSSYLKNIAEHAISQMVSR